MQSELKENIQGINSDRKETRTQSNDLEQKKKEINIHPEEKEETRIQKNGERLRNLWDNFKRSNIQIVGEPEEEQEKEVKNLFEQIMKDNFPNLAKEIDFQEAQETQRVPNKLDPRKHIPRHIIITSPKVEDKEGIFKKLFYCCSITVVCIFSPLLYPTPAKPFKSNFITVT